MTTSPDDRLEAAPAGERIVNHFRRATALYYMESKRIMVVGEDFIDCRKALAGLEVKVQRNDR